MLQRAAIDWNDGVDHPRSRTIAAVSPPDWQALSVVLNDRVAIYAEEFPAVLAGVGAAMLVDGPTGFLRVPLVVSPEPCTVRDVHVNVDNFVRAETARMFAALQQDAGAVNVFSHNRQPASIDHQTVIRLNRDTLYSFAVVDISEGAVLTLPDHGSRYVSAMIVNQDHFINGIFHDAGEHRLTVDRFETDHVVVAIRILVDPTDADDLREVATLQDQLVITAESAEPYVSPAFDTASLDSTREALLALASGLSEFDRTFGTRHDIDPVRHLIGTAAGWGGLPTEEATYIGVAPGLPVGQYELTIREVPVDGFWSISVYNAEGYFEPNAAGVYSVNSITGVRNDDDSMTVRFGDHGDLPNSIPIPEGWNYLVRLYRPHPEIINGRWSFPSLSQPS